MRSMIRMPKGAVLGLTVLIAVVGVVIFYRGYFAASLSVPRAEAQELVCLTDVDMNGVVEVSTDIIYIARHLLGLSPVPPSFRPGDPPIPSDAVIAAKIDAAGNAYDVDMNGVVEVTTDIIYIARHLLGLSPVPPSFRPGDPPIPTDEAIAVKIDALCSDPPAPALTQIETTPFNGESNVAVSRETIVRFTNPLGAATVVDENVLFAESGGQRLAARIHISADRRKATLFYDNPLPMNAAIQVSLVGAGLLDENGSAVDADGDGVEGGTALIEFRTAFLQPIDGTGVCGDVFASELGDGGTNVPLAGVTLSVDGMETLQTQTDAAGHFCLNPTPIVRFLVHIDGSTATNSVPDGAFYASVTKAFEPIVGEAIDVGNIFLPLVVAGTLQPVSQTQDTTITFPQAVLTEFPELAGTEIMVPAGSLFNDDGTPGSMVGIAPVAPDRLPGTLPPGPALLR